MSSYKAHDALTKLEENRADPIVALEPLRADIDHQVLMAPDWLAVWFHDGSAVVISSGTITSYEPEELPRSLEDYQIMCLRTAPIMELSKQLAHCAMGIVGETHEVYDASPSQDKMREECGDVMWYVAVAASYLQHRLDPSPVDVVALEGKSVQDLYLELMSTAATMTDAVKKAFFYGKPVNIPQVTAWLDQLWHGLKGLNVHAVRSSPLYTAQCNYAKLAARYRKSFSVEEAVNRDTAVEEAALKGVSQ